MPKEIVFISCGQQAQEERTLGEQICRLVRDLTPFEPYFAENQTSVDGLTANIFNALGKARGFIAVMHRRGWVFRDQRGEGASEARASVFVEQEIALAAFIKQSLGRELFTAGYFEEGIMREGVRGYIILNPKPFSAADEVLKDLARVLPTWVSERPSPPAALQLELLPKSAVGYIPGGGGTEDMVQVRLKNPGDRTVANWKVEVQVPGGLLDKGPYYAKRIADRSDATVDFFRITSSDPPRPTPIHGGDTHQVIDIRYPAAFLARASGRTIRAQLFVDDIRIAESSLELGN